MKKRGSLVLLWLRPLNQVEIGFRRAARTFALLCKHI
jgi:hypothetical protein